MAVATNNSIDLDSPDDVALADRMKSGRDQIVSELRKAIVGQDDVVSEVLLTLFVGGNSLIVGVPGLAKTLLVYTLARVLDLKFSRIQFTPDLMPSDITGTDLIQEDPATGRREMVFAPGPIFANIVLADEINRTPPKTQAALLEAMQEHRVTIQGRTYQLQGVADDRLRSRHAAHEPLKRHEIGAAHRPLEIDVPQRRRRPHHFVLLVDGRVIDHDVEHEAIELRLGQRVRAFELDRVLRRKHVERLLERIRAPLDLSLIHI